MQFELPENTHLPRWPFHSSVLETGGGSVDQVEKLMNDQLRLEDYVGRVIVVRFKK